MTFTWAEQGLPIYVKHPSLAALQAERLLHLVGLMFTCARQWHAKGCPGSTRCRITTQYLDVD